MFVVKAAVVGAGTMGGEIARAIAAAGIPVVLKDVDQRRVDAALERAREIGRDRAEEIVGRIHGTLAYEDLRDADFVIEAVPERMDVKQAVFAELDAATPGHAILASAASGLSITEIGDATSRPDKVVGFHLYRPLSSMRLVEVVEGDETSPETAHAAASFVRAIKKVPVRCGECPGFVVDRILMSLSAELWRYQDESGVSPEAIDEYVTGQELAPTGPFRLADTTGLDTGLKVARDMVAAYGDRFYVHRGMEALVASGDLGRKSGRGFYAYG